MPRLSSLKLRLRAGVGLGLVIAAICAVSFTLATVTDTRAADTKPERKVKKKLTGAELYAINCSRCHPERYPTEWNSSHWKTLMTHMRVRANLPAKQAREVLKYLQEDSGS